MTIVLMVTSLILTQQCMSPSVLLYGSVDNDKCRKVISTHTHFLYAYESEQKENTSWISEFSSKMDSVFLVNIIYSNQSFTVLVLC